MRSLSQLAGIGAFVVLVIAAIWIWRPQQSVVPVTQSSVQSTLGTRIAERDEVLGELIGVTTERPLFHGSRKPPQNAEPAVPAPPPKPTLTLVGVLSDQDERIALVRISNREELYRVTAGGQLANWRIIEVGDNFVSVQEDGEAVVTLSMDAP